LTQSDDVNHVYSTCKTKDIHIDNLINNAGFGGYGAYEQASRDQHTDMIDLNIIALMRLTYLFLDDMKAAGHGRILQVASTAGMVPGPMQAVYHATKAFVVSLTDSLAIELEDTDITITALCPGPVETGFAEQADVADVAAFQSAADATTVAQDGYDAMMAGELFRISGLPRYYRMMIRLMPLLPRSLVVSQIKQSVTKSS
jgi:short-subunit dehydrogenase